MPKFKILEGIHVDQDGNVHTKASTAKNPIETDDELDLRFRNKFERVDGPTKFKTDVPNPMDKNETMDPPENVKRFLEVRKTKQKPLAQTGKEPREVERTQDVPEEHDTSSEDAFEAHIRKKAAASERVTKARLNDDDEEAPKKSKAAKIQESDAAADDASEIAQPSDEDEEEVAIPKKSAKKSAKKSSIKKSSKK